MQLSMAGRNSDDVKATENAREARLAQALRDNLRKRKAQRRERKDAPDKDDSEG